MPDIHTKLAQRLLPPVLLCGCAKASCNLMFATCAAGLDATAIKSTSTAFKSYDSCRLSLLSLVHVLVQYTSSRTLSHAILQALPAYIDRVRSPFAVLGPPAMSKERLQRQSSTQ